MLAHLRFVSLTHRLSPSGEPDFYQMPEVPPSKNEAVTLSRKCALSPSPLPLSGLADALRSNLRQRRDQGHPPEIRGHPTACPPVSQQLHHVSPAPSGQRLVDRPPSPSVSAQLHDHHQRGTTPLMGPSNATQVVLPRPNPEMPAIHQLRLPSTLQYLPYLPRHDCLGHREEEGFSHQGERAPQFLKVFGSVFALVHDPAQLQLAEGFESGSVSRTLWQYSNGVLHAPASAAPRAPVFALAPNPRQFYVELPRDYAPPAHNAETHALDYLPHHFAGARAPPPNWRGHALSMGEQTVPQDHPAPQGFVVTQGHPSCTTYVPLTSQENPGDYYPGCPVSTDEEVLEVGDRKLAAPPPTGDTEIDSRSASTWEHDNDLLFEYPEMATGCDALALDEFDLAMNHTPWT